MPPRYCPPSHLSRRMGRASWMDSRHRVLYATIQRPNNEHEAFKQTTYGSSHKLNLFVAPPLACPSRCCDLQMYADLACHMRALYPQTINFLLSSNCYSDITAFKRYCPSLSLPSWQSHLENLSSSTRPKPLCIVLASHLDPVNRALWTCR